MILFCVHGMLLRKKELQMNDKSLTNKSKSIGLESLSLWNYVLRLCDRFNPCYKRAIW
jgi:hypothetical protein